MIILILELLFLIRTLHPQSSLLFVLVDERSANDFVWLLLAVLLIPVKHDVEFVALIAMRASTIVLVAIAVRLSPVPFNVSLVNL